MIKEVFGQDAMTQFMKEVFPEGKEGSTESLEARFGWLDCGFCPILWPVAISIAAVEFGIAGVLVSAALTNNVQELNALAAIIGNTATFEQQSAGKLNALCKCKDRDHNYPCV